MKRFSNFAGQLRIKINHRPSVLDFQDVNLPSAIGFNFPGYSYRPNFGPSSPRTPLPAPKPLELRRNKTEGKRLQGLMQQRHHKYDGHTFGDSTEDLHASDRRSDEMKVHKLRSWSIQEGGGRRIFFAFWILLHALVFGLGLVHYFLKDNLNTARVTFGWTYPIARSAALVLHVEVAILLLPICRSFITIARRTQLNSLIPFDANITFHKSIGWGILLFSTVHTAAHMRNFYRLAQVSNTGAKGFAMANFATGPGITGWIMTLILLIMIWFAIEKRRRSNYNRFYYSHHLFIVFFAMWQLHGMFCMIPNDDTKKCDYWQVGVFWKYFLISGVVFVFERIMREVRSRHRTYISKVIEHPGGVIEVQIKKEKINVRAGQYIFINCPDISYFQWHPFTLTSAPEEDFISVNIKMVGDWTKAFGKAIGCVNGKDSARSPLNRDGKFQCDEFENVALSNAPLRPVLPRIMVDGPFGSASEDYHKFEVVMLCAAGIGVTPFASILKSIWYRMNNPQSNKRTLLSKIYFIHICRDTIAVSWFRSVLAAIEAQDSKGSIEIMTYVTGKLATDDLTNIMLEDVGSEKDAISGLRAPTHYGRPNWDRIFASVRERHPNTEVGTLFCGPKPLGSTLHNMCNKWSSGDKDGTRFVFMKENF